jgi:hypothetical protein
VKLRINICHIYLIVILLCALNGTLYSGGSFIAQALQYVLILMSLYYAVYANLTYKLPVYFKALNVLLVLFTVYGMLLLMSGERLIIQMSLRETSNTDYLKNIYKSLLPVYPFFVFTKQGLLKEKTIKIWFFIFFVLAIRWFYNQQAHMLAAALERGSSAEEFTNNVGYTFLALLPALVLFHKRPIIQYIGIMACSYFIVIAMKRGAIVVAVICLIWFMSTNFKTTQRNHKWIVLVVNIIMIVAAVFLFRYMMETSAYFRYRLEETRAGNSSGRDEIYAALYNHFINEENPLRFLIGYGADATLKFADNYAHNDWLEIATNQGLLGIVVYLVYWICFYVSWRKAKWHPQAFMAIGLVLIIYFISTFFSMSYNSVGRCAAMVLGYYLAVASDTSEAVPEETLDTSQTMRREDDNTPKIINPVF